MHNNTDLKYTSQFTVSMQILFFGKFLIRLKTLHVVNEAPATLT